MVLTSGPARKEGKEVIEQFMAGMTRGAGTFPSILITNVLTAPRVLMVSSIIIPHEYGHLVLLNILVLGVVHFPSPPLLCEKGLAR